jgi:hypothetical protein
VGPGLGVLHQRLDPVGLVKRLVERGDPRVQNGTQGFGVAEVTVQVDLGKEQRQVLKVLPHNGLIATGAPPLVDRWVTATMA